MSEEIYRKVAEVISQGTKIPVERIHPDSDFEELGMDSLDATTLLFNLEETFDLTIPDEEAKKLKNVKQVVDLLKNLGVCID